VGVGCGQQRPFWQANRVCLKPTGRLETPGGSFGVASSAELVARANRLKLN